MKLLCVFSALYLYLIEYIFIEYTKTQLADTSAAKCINTPFSKLWVVNFISGIGLSIVALVALFVLIILIYNHYRKRDV